MPAKYDRPVKEEAVRLVREHAADYPSEYATTREIAGRMGMSTETLRLWIWQALLLSSTPRREDAACTKMKRA
jgi:transposase